MAECNAYGLACVCAEVNGAVYVTVHCGSDGLLIKEFFLLANKCIYCIVISSIVGILRCYIVAQGCACGICGNLELGRNCPVVGMEHSAGSIVVRSGEDAAFAFIRRVVQSGTNVEVPIPVEAILVSINKGPLGNFFFSLEVPAGNHVACGIFGIFAALFTGGVELDFINCEEETVGAVAMSPCNIDILSCVVGKVNDELFVFTTCQVCVNEAFHVIEIVIGYNVINICNVELNVLAVSTEVSCIEPELCVLGNCCGRGVEDPVVGSKHSARSIVIGLGSCNPFTLVFYVFRKGVDAPLIGVTIAVIDIPVTIGALIFPVLGPVNDLLCGFVTAALGRIDLGDFTGGEVNFECGLVACIVAAEYVDLGCIGLVVYTYGNVLLGCEAGLLCDDVVELSIGCYANVCKEVLVKHLNIAVFCEVECRSGGIKGYGDHPLTQLVGVKVIIIVIEREAENDVCGFAFGDTLAREVNGEVGVREGYAVITNVFFSPLIELRSVEVVPAICKCDVKLYHLSISDKCKGEVVYSIEDTIAVRGDGVTICKVVCAGGHCNIGVDAETLDLVARPEANDVSGHSGVAVEGVFSGCFLPIESTVENGLLIPVAEEAKVGDAEGCINVLALGCLRLKHDVTFDEVSVDIVIRKNLCDNAEVSVNGDFNGLAGLYRYGFRHIEACVGAEVSGLELGYEDRLTIILQTTDGSINKSDAAEVIGDSFFAEVLYEEAEGVQAVVGLTEFYFRSAAFGQVIVSIEKCIGGNRSIEVHETCTLRTNEFAVKDGCGAHEDLVGYLHYFLCICLGEALSYVFLDNGHTAGNMGCCHGGAAPGFVVRVGTETDG